MSEQSTNTPAAPAMTPAESLAAAKLEAGVTSAPAQTSPAPGGEPAPVQDASTDAAAPDPGPEIIKRSSVIAEREHRFREQKKQFKTQLADADTLAKAKAAIKAGNDLEALQLLGIDADDHYGRLTQTFLLQKEPPTPDQLIDQKVEAKLKAQRDAEAEQTKQREQDDLKQIQGAYLQKTYAVLDANADKYPAVLRALGTRKLTESDICEAVEVYFVQKRVAPTVDTILGLIQEQLSPSKNPAAQSKPAAKPIVPANSSWTNHAPPQPAKPMTREESLREAKRAAGLQV